MQSYPQSAFPPVQMHDGTMKQPRQHSEVVYQLMTVAAMVIVLVTVWIF
jgi:hypothetical protein